MNHNLKTWPEYFEQVWQGKKNFEVRKNDRLFIESDTLTLREYDPENMNYTGRGIDCEISYILIGGSFGIDKDYCVLGLKNITPFTNQ